MQKEIIVFVPLELGKQIPEDWESRLFIYKGGGRIPVDTSLFEERDGALIKISGTGRLEFNQMLILEPYLLADVLEIFK